jgi:hypothetical protein
MDFFKAFPNEKRLPGLSRTDDGRWQMSRVLSLGDGTEVKAADLTLGAAFTFERSNAERDQIKAAGIDPATFRITGISLGGQGEEVMASYRYEQCIDHNIYRDMAIQFPGVRPSAWTLLDDFPFRSEPTSRVVTVRVARKFFVTNDPRRIPLLDAFRPISSRTGDEVTVLDDDSSVTSDEYLGWVASGTEFVDRCLRQQVAGGVWARDTYWVRAE